MPYYYWKGVTLEGAVKAGRLFAVSPEALDQQLFKRDIALIKFDEAFTWFLPRLSVKTQAQFFDQLATLLDAGILVPQSLSLVRDTMGHVRMQLVLADIAKDVESGYSLSNAMQNQQDCFDDRMVQMVFIGQESGSLPVTVKALAIHLETVIAFREKIKSAAMSPLISFIFFIVIVLVIVIFVMPTMASIFSSVNQPMPFITYSFLSASQFLRSWYGLLITGTVMSLIVLGLRAMFMHKAVINAYDKIVLKIPFLRNIVLDTQRAWYLESVALLISGGMQLVPALQIAQRSFTNSVLQEQGRQISLAVAAGASFSNAINAVQSDLFPHDCVAIIQVGEDAGALANGLQKAALDARARALRHVSFISRVIQPLLLIVLGLMITLLILAVYSPILTISWTIG